ncbi:hypothetical protein LJC63_11600 [Ruminococcaceae bacterium OttesenSCG-928-L11]|nr:hypothetical protein [Ruminococcaceae bacterium OttesenSCG-928-L11]
MTVMDTVKRTTQSLIAAMLAALLILLGTGGLAKRAAESTLLMQSRFARTVLAQDSMNPIRMVTEPQKLNVLLKFIGAVTTAYINFEMIPVNEAQTFVVLFESAGDDIAIESFAYHGKKLLVTGTAPTAEACERFRDALEDKRYFSSVALHQYTTTDDEIRFEMECA